LSDVASVASFFVSRVDTKVDGQLPQGSPLRGKIAVANARLAYQRFLAIFSGPRWDRLKAAGARVQRPLWASTGTKNPEYSDVLYVEELVAPNTVNTMPEATLRAFLDHGRTAPAIERGLAEAERTAAQAAAEGIDLKAICAQLLDKGLTAFRGDFAQLLEEIGKVLHALPEHRAYSSANLDGFSKAVEQRLLRFDKENMSSRLWEGDYTLWKPQPAEITNRLGWLRVVDMMMDYQAQLAPFAEEVAKDGYNAAVLLGMGGSSLGPEVLFATYGAAPGALALSVLDTTDPGAIRAVEDSIELERTLFIVASKSGTTLETLSHFAYFWEKIPDPRHFIAITDAGTPLEKLGRERDFRRVFLNPTEIGGRYSVLSYFGLVPAALIGMDLGALLDRAHDMLHACHPCVDPAENPGAWLGAVMAEAALAGRDKLTLVLPQEISTFGYWVEQLIAESTGKEGKGILPVEGEPLGPPEVYGNDRLFVAIGEDGLAPLEQAGHPVIQLPYSGPLDLGAEFFRWEFATAVAGHVLGINPFDQPNVQQAKDATGRILAAGRAPADPEIEPLTALLDRVHPGDYIALQAYLPRNATTDARLQAVRVRLRDRHRVATTVGYGPRFLHSTGQLHKGGPNTGVFIQVMGRDDDDLPIPGKPYTFGALKRAQALGDLESLRVRGARVTRLDLDELEEALR
jgi:transaldolase/glucose-6-phosphate isomerase